VCARSPNARTKVLTGSLRLEVRASSQGYPVSSRRKKTRSRSYKLKSCPSSSESIGLRNWVGNSGYPLSATPGGTAMPHTASLSTSQWRISAGIGDNSSPSNSVAASRVSPTRASTKAEATCEAVLTTSGVESEAYRHWSPLKSLRSISSWTTASCRLRFKARFASSATRPLI
jgi:hypothetical protein